MSEIAAFTGTIEGRFVDDDDLRQSGRAWVEIDNAEGLLALPVSAEYTALRQEVVQHSQAAQDAAAGVAGTAAQVEARIGDAETARDAAVLARNDAEGFKAQAATSATNAAADASAAASSASAASGHAQSASVEADRASSEADRAEAAAQSAATGVMPDTVGKAHLTPALRGEIDGKASTSHTHLSADVTDSVYGPIISHPNRLVKTGTDGYLQAPIVPTNSSHAASKAYVDGQVGKKADASHTHPEYATTTEVEARTPEIRIVSTIPASPTPGVVYLRFG